MSQGNDLKKAAHNLKPLVIIGDKGLTSNVLSEIDNCLNAHELIKVRINEKDRERRVAMIDTIIEHNNSTLVNHIGHVVVIYRKNENGN